MMTCAELIAFLDDYRSGALAADERAALEGHLVQCPACIAYVRSYEEAIRLGKDAFSDRDDPVPAEVPPDLIDAILASRRAHR